MKIVVGVDLAGSATRPTGFCLLKRNLSVKTNLLYDDSEIITEIRRLKPHVVAVDAPLALPKGRESLEKRSDIHLRACDRELLNRGIKFFPLTLGPMRKLTERGIRLKGILEKEGFEVIEVYPGAAQDLLNIPRKKAGVEVLRKTLVQYGFTGDVMKKSITDHELDAITSALVAKMYIEGEYEAIGDPEEVLMILPKVRGSI